MLTLQKECSDEGATQECSLFMLEGCMHIITRCTTGTIKLQRPSINATPRHIFTLPLCGYVISHSFVLDAYKILIITPSECGYK